MNHFDIQYHIADYLESHDLGNFRLVCTSWYNVYWVHLKSRCFKCLKRAPFLYESNKCHRKACSECIRNRMYNIYHTSMGAKLDHKKRIKIMFHTYLEYSTYLRTNKLLVQNSYTYLCELIEKARFPFRDRLLEYKAEYEREFGALLT